MYGKVKNIWDIKTNGGGSSIDTENFASKIKANTFTQKNTFSGTGDIATFQTTSEAAGGIDFKHNGSEDSNRIGYIGGSQNTPNKMTIYGRDGLIIQTPNTPINVSAGNEYLTYSTSRTTAPNNRPWNEVLRRDDFIYRRAFNYTSVLNINSDDYATFEQNYSFQTGLNKVILLIIVNGVDITAEMYVYVNVNNYPNQSEVKTISLANFTGANIDANGFLYVGVMLKNNKIRVRFKNTHSERITINTVRCYIGRNEKIQN